MEKQTKLAIAFADICGSTKYYESLGNEAAYDLISNSLELMASVVESHGGRVVKTVGDEVVCCFAAPDNALLACSTMQARIRDNPWEQKLCIRVGLNYGEALEKHGDVFGDSVNVAARLSVLSGAGQILTTQSMLDSVSAPLRATTRKLSSSQLRGKVEETSIYEVIWDTSFELTTMSGSLITAMLPVLSEMTVEFGATALAVNNNRPLVTLGRDPGNVLVVNDSMVSRFHAEISLRNGKFYVRDRSANGTFVQLAGGEIVKLLHDEMILLGNGYLGLGKIPDGPGDGVAFRL